MDAEQHHQAVLGKATGVSEAPLPSLPRFWPARRSRSLNNHAWLDQRERSREERSSVLATGEVGPCPPMVVFEPACQPCQEGC